MTTARSPPAPSAANGRRPLLAQQRRHDLRLLLAELWQLTDSLEQFGAGLRLALQHRRVTVVALDEHATASGYGLPSLWGSDAARAYGQRSVPSLGVVPGQFVGIQLMPEALLQDVRRTESLLQGDLLVEDHANQQRKRTAQQVVRGSVNG
jgi:hypothetical protein